MAAGWRDAFKPHWRRSKAETSGMRVTGASQRSAYNCLQLLKSAYSGRFNGSSTPRPLSFLVEIWQRARTKYKQFWPFETYLNECGWIKWFAAACDGWFAPDCAWKRVWLLHGFVCSYFLSVLFMIDFLVVFPAQHFLHSVDLISSISVVSAWER